MIGIHTLIKGNGSEQPVRVNLETQKVDSIQASMVTIKGGPGSGNFGHGGRPGEIGGSSSEGNSRSSTEGISFKKSGNKTIDKQVEKILSSLDPKALKQLTTRKPLEISVSGKFIGKSVHWGKLKYFTDVRMGMHSFRSNKIEIYSRGIRHVFGKEEKDMKQGITNVLFHELGHAALRKGPAVGFIDEEGSANKWGRKNGEKFGFSW